MKGRELHRDARPVRQGGVAGGPADRLDRPRIGLGVGAGILGGAGALAEHVEGVAEQPALAAARPPQRRPDRLAEHEVVAHHPHGLPRRLPHRRLAEPPGEAVQHALRRLARIDDAGRQPERPGRGVDQQGVRARGVLLEAAAAQLVLDQPVGGGGVRHPQQRLRQHHQGEALLGGERIFPQQRLDAAEAAVLRPDRRNEIAGQRVHPRLPLRAEGGTGQEAAGEIGVVGGVGAHEAGKRGGHRVRLCGSVRSTP